MGVSIFSERKGPKAVFGFSEYLALINLLAVYLFDRNDILLGIYNKKVRQILESLGIPMEREVELSPDRLSTWVIWEHLDRAMKYEKQAHGSNIQDKYMGIFSLFVDVFTVDRRVNEYFRQLSRKNPKLSACLGNIVKLSNYSELISIG